MKEKMRASLRLMRMELLSARILMRRLGFFRQMESNAIRDLAQIGVELQVNLTINSQVRRKSI